MNLETTIQLVEVYAGGPGSGRHPLNHQVLRNGDHKVSLKIGGKEDGELVYTKSIHASSWYGERNRLYTEALEAGGPGSGCHGPNCGRHGHKEDEKALRRARKNPNQTSIFGPGHTKELSEKAKRALKYMKPMTADKHKQAMKVQGKVARALGGYETNDNKPFDVYVGQKAAIEVKAIIDQTNDKITMNARAIRLKNDAIEKNGLTAFTVAVDIRGGSTKIYYRQGIGSFRLGSMTPVNSWRGLRNAIYSKLTGRLF